MNNEELLGMIMSGDALTWERLIYDIVEKEELNPWDINVSKLSSEFSNRIKALEKLDFRLPGKVILAAAILLRMKSDRIDLDGILGRKKRVVNKEGEEVPDFDYSAYTIEPNLPFPRDRRVTLPELMEALRRALEINNKRAARMPSHHTYEMEVKPAKFNIRDKMMEVFDRIKLFFKKKNRTEMLFEELLPSNKREDVVWTFMPLMFLANNQNIALRQEELFGPLYINIENEELRNEEGEKK